MKHRRKTTRCLNCNLRLDEIYHYCPNCGQENNDLNVSIGTFVHDFFANYISFDAKIWRSLFPFFFKPGYLTNCFNEGKRVSYVHPLRLYLIISVLFFFIATTTFNRALTATSEAFNKTVAGQNTAAGESVIQNNNTLREIMELMSEESLSDKQVIDSLQAMDVLEIDTTSWISRQLFQQARRASQNNMELFVAYMMQHLPLLMFLLMPLSALLLKLFYVRQRIFYVQHLIHALHLHTFLFVLFGLILSCYLLFTVVAPWDEWVNTSFLFVGGLYVYVSFLYVYRQHWFKTAIKFLLLSTIYFFITLFFGITEAFTAFLFF